MVVAALASLLFQGNTANTSVLRQALHLAEEVI